MCGIIGIVGKNAYNTVLDGLKALEYRGYDSYGVAGVETDGLVIEKRVGTVDGKLDGLRSKSCTTAIGHTRWATHGKVTEANAHPHASNDGTIAVVHNGIIENYAELRAELESKGTVFKSETDTEVIPLMIECELKRQPDFFTAFLAVLSRLEGSFAIAAVHKGEPRVYFARRNSPLVLGIKPMTVASDPNVVSLHTDEAIMLDENEAGWIGKKAHVFDLKTGAAKHKARTLLEKAASQTSSDSFMLAEIQEQATLLAKPLQRSEPFAAATDILLRAEDIILTGAGTSYHAALAGVYAFATAKVEARAILASEIGPFTCFHNKAALIALSQSGETADVLDAVRDAKTHGTKVIAVVNMPGSSLSRLADVVIPLEQGAEQCVLSTKSYTGQLAVLFGLARSCTNALAQWKQAVDVTVASIARMLPQWDEIVMTLARRLKDCPSIFVIGRHEAYPLALEAALKIKEASYIHAEGFAAAELKHGTLALIEKGTPCIAIMTAGTRKQTLNNAMEVKARGGFIISVDTHNHPCYDAYIPVPEGDETILRIVPLQLLAYHLAVERGINPDRPRNLAKSVTVR